MFKKFKKKMSGDAPPPPAANNSRANAAPPAGRTRPNAAPTAAAAARPARVPDAAALAAHREREKKNSAYEAKLENMKKNRELEGEEMTRLKRNEVLLDKANAEFARVAKTKDEAMKKRAFLQVKKLKEERVRINGRLVNYQNMIEALQSQMEAGQQHETMTAFSQATATQIVTEDEVVEEYETMKEVMEEAKKATDYLTERAKDDMAVDDADYDAYLAEALEQEAEKAGQADMNAIIATEPTPSKIPHIPAAAAPAKVNTAEEEFRRLERELAG